MRLLVVGVLVAGCGAHNFATPDGRGSSNDGSDAGASDASSADAPWTWTSLISNSWSLGAAPTPPRASISCATMPITQEMWIDGFRPAAGMSPENDHQLLVITSDGNAGDCSDPFQNDDANAEVVFATGLGSSSELELPSGTAVHLVPGTGSTMYLKLYDHLVNDMASTISGTSAIEIHQVADPSTVAHDVDMVMAGMGSFSVPANQSKTVPGSCFPTIDSPGYQWHIVGLWPHMHESGTHVTVSVAGTSILDTDYTYQDERTYVIPEALVDTGAELDVVCSLANANPVALEYDESKAEAQGGTVCWTGIYKWPTGTNPSTAQGVTYGPEACVQSIGLHH